jgi:hypothetical protein
MNKFLQPAMSPKRRRPSEFSLQVWTLVARHGMTPASAAKRLATSTRRVERILIGVSRRNAQRWH